jgi:hypothetical protein
MDSGFRPVLKGPSARVIFKVILRAYFLFFCKVLPPKDNRISVMGHFERDAACFALYIFLNCKSNHAALGCPISLLKLPAVPLNRDLRFAPTSCRESSKCKELIHFIVVRSLTPQQATGIAFAVAFSTSQTWFLGPSQCSMALPVQVRAFSEYWSIGVLECWQK